MGDINWIPKKYFKKIKNKSNTKNILLKNKNHSKSVSNTNISKMVSIGGSLSFLIDKFKKIYFMPIHVNISSFSYVYNIISIS
jgi:hypothetical protein